MARFFECFFGSSEDVQDESQWSENLRKNLGNLRPKESSIPSEEYGKFREEIRALSAPAQVLGFTSEPSSRGEIEHNYKQLVLHLHPDKVGALVKQKEKRDLSDKENAEAEFLFACATFAKDILLKRLEDSSVKTTAQSAGKEGPVIDPVD